MCHFLTFISPIESSGCPEKSAPGGLTRFAFCPDCSLFRGPFATPGVARVRFRITKGTGLYARALLAANGLVHDLKRHAGVLRPACLRGPIDIAGRVQNQIAAWVVSVRALSEDVHHFIGPAAG